MAKNKHRSRINCKTIMAWTQWHASEEEEKKTKHYIDSSIIVAWFCHAFVRDFEQFVEQF